MGRKKKEPEKPDYLPLSSPCGLDCFNCPAYLAKEDQELRKFVAMRAQVPFEDAVCEGCRAQCGQIELFGAAEPCKVYKCINEKGYEFCYECEDFPCDNLQPYADQSKYTPHNVKVFNLCMIKKLGLMEWAEKYARSIRDKYFNDDFEV